MENRIDLLFRQKKSNILSVFITAGFPRLESIAEILEILEEEGVDMVEIGIPFSDPIADGPVIQQSSHQALQNGMNLRLLFSQLEKIREKITIPLLLMGYFNPVFRFGVEQFCQKCTETGIDGVILPDLPPEEYLEEFSHYFTENNIHNIFLITPQTSGERIIKIDRITTGFIYVVSSTSTTGTAKITDEFYSGYFDRIRSMNLRNPCLIGFGISDADSFNIACRYASGAIIGSAFIRSFSDEISYRDTIPGFVRGIRNLVN